MWHLWNRGYRPTYEGEHLVTSKFSRQKQKKVRDLFTECRRIRRIIYGDKEYRHYLDENFGIDLLGRQGTSKCAHVGLDPYYYFHKDLNWFKSPKMKIVE